MNNPTDPELNRRIIELSRAISSLVDSAATPKQVTTVREDALLAVTEQSDKARKKLSNPSTRK